jgi:adenylate cyclase
MGRRLAAILSADMVGYSKRMAEDEDGTLAILKAHRLNFFDPAVARFHGRIFKLIGDGVLVEFSSVLDAIECAISVQQALIDEVNEVNLRIGINLGDVIIDGDDIYGDGVNIAVRLEAMAEPGGICISSTVYEQIRHKRDTEFFGLGKIALKNIPEPVEAWLWSPPGSRFKALASRSFKLPDKPSIAVLPFANMSGEHEQDYFADGITEDIVTGLSKCRWLFVIARNSTNTYKGTETDVGTVSRELGVRYVLEGSVRKIGNRVRITGNLINALTGVTLLAERYDRDLINIFELQDDITQSVVAAIEPALRKAEIDRIKRTRPDDLDAYDLYLRALAHMYKVNPEDRATALDFIEQALKIDPTYAEAHGVAAWCYFAKSLWEGNLPDPYKDAMLEHVHHVLELQPEDATTLAHAAISLALSTSDYPSALAIIERAISINPSSAHAYGHGSVINTWAGNYDKSIEYSERAIRLSPFDPLSVMPLAGQAGARMMKGEYEEAINCARRALQVYPTHTPSFLITIVSLMRLGMTNDAQTTSLRFMALSPTYRIRPHVPVFKHFVTELKAAGLPG